ncbi:sodium/proton-translocating pyrophosphatase [bacterium]|nr:sodium/proton-translocating pyrophosphatase [bacterium]
MIFNEILQANVLQIMNIASVIFAFEFIVLLAILFFKRVKNKKLFKNVTENLRYEITEIFSVFFSGVSISVLYILYTNYFDNLDVILSSLLIIAVLILINIVLKIINMLARYNKEFTEFLFTTLLKGIDGVFLVIILTQTCAILASLIPIVDITRFFGTGIKRATLINFPFFIMVLNLLVSNIGLILQYFIRKLDVKVRQYINEFFEIFSFVVVVFWTTFCFSISYNIFLIFMVGIIGSYIIIKLSTYLKNIKMKNINKLSDNFKLLYPISNAVASTFLSGVVMCLMIFISLRFGNFYGIAVAALSMISFHFLSYTTNVIYKNSESYRYVAKTLNNLVLFYVFFETLEFVVKKQISINIFSDSVIIGLFLSIILVVFNLLKIVNLAKYAEMKTKRVYLFLRSALYIALFCVCFYFLFPYINYEILASFVFGLIVLTSFISLICMNVSDIIDSLFGSKLKICDVTKNTFIPILNQITTLLIIITILLLPIIKIRM